MNIWIVDNNLPVEQCRDRRVKTGQHPIDRETLAGLVTKGDLVWKADTALKDICKALLRMDALLLGFQRPANAAAYMENTSARPDLVLFDWDFGDGSDAASLLADLYKASFFMTQIFSNKPKEDIERAVAANANLRSYSRLCLPTLTKGTTNIDEVAKQVEESSEENVGRALASDIRRKSTKAVECTLRDLGALPLTEALEILGRKKSGVELSELAEGVAAVIVGALQEMAQGKIDVSGGSFDDFKQAALDTVVSRVKASLEEQSETIKALKDAPGRSSVRLDEEHKNAVQRFMNFQMYHNPGDDFVRQGDLFRIVDAGDNSAVERLYLVLNAACDLERFCAKTRELLTCLIIHPLSKEQGLPNIGKGGNVFLKAGRSILSYSKKGGSASGGAIFLPGVRDENGGAAAGFVDYVGIAQDITALRPIKAASVKDEDRLTYASFTFSDGSRARRVCTIQFAFVPAILGTVTNGIAGYGVPDLPQAERDRLTALAR